jgi:hypothetical protein
MMKVVRYIINQWVMTRKLRVMLFLSLCKIRVLMVRCSVEEMIASSWAHITDAAGMVP